MSVSVIREEIYGETMITIYQKITRCSDCFYTTEWNTCRLMPSVNRNDLFRSHDGRFIPVWCPRRS